MRIDVVKSELSLSLLSTILKLSAWIHVSLNTNLLHSKLKYIIGVGAWKVLSYIQWTCVSWLFRQEIFWQRQRQHSFSICAWIWFIVFRFLKYLPKIQNYGFPLYYWIHPTCYMSRQQLSFPLQIIWIHHMANIIFWYHYDWLMVIEINKLWRWIDRGILVPLCIPVYIHILHVR